MKFVNSHFAVTAAVAFISMVSPAAMSQPPPLALVGGTLIDGTGREPIRNSVVLVRGGRVERVGSVDAVPVPSGYERVSTEGMTVLPGLWDLHVHLIYSGHPNLVTWLNNHAERFRDVTMPASARQLIEAGITSIRDLAAPLDAVLSIRSRIEQGELPGPTIYAAGPGLVPGSLPEMPHALRVTGPSDAAAQARELATAGVDVIKVFGAAPESADAVRAIVEAAHGVGLRVTAHGRTDEEIRVGLAAGVDEFQHIGIETPAFPPDVVEMIRARIEAGRPLYWSPTIGAEANRISLARDAEFLDAPRNFVGLPAEMTAEIRSALASTPPEPPPPELMSTLRRKIEQLRELGVTFVSGSDEGTFGQTPSDALWRDLDVWVREFGVAPSEAISWVTAAAAEYMGVLDEVGTVTEGKYADIIAVDGNPLEHLAVLRSPVVVLKHGTRVK